MSSKQAVLEAVEGTDRYSTPLHGVECYYLKLDEVWGVKVYEDEDKRDECYELQEKAAEHGLGPEVGEWFDLPNYKYCYVTETVEILFHAFNEDYIKRQAFYRQNINDLLDGLEDIGFVFKDNHHKNLGIKDGRLVCIDFGVDDGD
jgi:hypothetical protein